MVVKAALLRRLYPVMWWHSTLLGFSNWVGFPPAKHLPCVHAAIVAALGILAQPHGNGSR